MLFSHPGDSKDAPVSGKGFKKPASRSLGEPAVNTQTPVKPTILKPKVSQTEPRHHPISRYLRRIVNVQLFNGTKYLKCLSYICPCSPPV